MAHGRHLLRSMLGRTSSGTSAPALIALAVAASLWAMSPVAAQTSSDTPSQDAPTSKPETSASEPAEPSTPSTNTGEPRLVWTEVTTEAGTMMVLRPASDPNAQPGDLVNPSPSSDRPEEFSSLHPPTSPGLSPRTSTQPYGSNAPPHLPVSAFGVYGGFPSAVGFQFVIPTDATLAFRTGFTGLPGIGYLLTPGVELRFNQTPGTYNTDSAYGFSNLYIGETVKDGPNDSHWGLETGIGYRWILPDRRGVRWIAAVEFGGRWTTESTWPTKPSMRAFWMIAAP